MVYSRVDILGSVKQFQLVTHMMKNKKMDAKIDVSLLFLMYFCLLDIYHHRDVLRGN